ncbi:MAG: hypothetical protein A2070_04825 [Bdellovibrionales bacterium GWC1_52_8]|nr:MAG: hypothetical protein A2070_04825 [Bdellovibrionales bacterium GWC1_52_8]
MSGCSLFNKGSAEGEDETPIADASTDAIPLDSAEAPPPPADEFAEAQPPMDTPPADPALEVAAAPIDTPPPVDPAPEDPAPVDPAPAAPAVAASGEGETYTVTGGETLMRIAFDKYGDIYKWRDIYEANRAAITDPNAIPAGTVLKLDQSGFFAADQNGEKYLIKRGDTLGTISGDVYGTQAKWRKLWENNRKLIRDPNLIFAGFYLYYVPENEQLAPKDQRLPASGEASTGT